jgi:squalene cyclase
VTPTHTSRARAGVAFLLERQGEDGLWRDFKTVPGESADWVTGYVGRSLQRAGAPRSSLARAAGALLERQRPDGGWGYHEGVPTDADSTAYVSIFLATGGWMPSEAAERALACLERHQRQPDGGVATYADEEEIRQHTEVPATVSFRGWCRPHVEVSAAAGLAALALGGRGRRAALGAWRFIQPRQQPSGKWESYWWTLPHYPTSIAVAFASALPASRGVAEGVQGAVRWAREAQAANGSWTTLEPSLPSPFATALGVSILATGGAPKTDVERGVKALLEAGDDDGGWPSHPVLRIPPSDVEEPADLVEWRVGELGWGVVIADQHRLYTTATAIGALADAGRLSPPRLKSVDSRVAGGNPPGSIGGAPQPAAGPGDAGARKGQRSGFPATASALLERLGSLYGLVDELEPARRVVGRLPFVIGEASVSLRPVATGGLRTTLGIPARSGDPEGRLALVAALSGLGAGIMAADVDDALALAAPPPRGSERGVRSLALRAGPGEPVRPRPGAMVGGRDLAERSARVADALRSLGLEGAAGVHERIAGELGRNPFNVAFPYGLGFDLGVDRALGAKVYWSCEWPDVAFALLDGRLAEDFGLQGVEAIETIASCTHADWRRTPWLLELSFELPADPAWGIRAKAHLPPRRFASSEAQAHTAALRIASELGLDPMPYERLLRALRPDGLSPERPCTLSAGVSTTAGGASLEVYVFDPAGSLSAR